MKQPLGVILAGGQARRMGGQDKASIVLGGQTLLARAIDRLEPQVAGLAISSNAAIPAQFPTLADTMPGFPGPLAGILSGLRWAAEQGADHVVSVAVDTPFFPADLVPRLLLAGLDHPNGLAIAQAEDGAHPTFGIWPVALAQSLQTSLEQGLRKMTDWTDAQNAARATFATTAPDTFFNINTPDDLAKAEGYL